MEIFNNYLQYQARDIVDANGIIKVDIFMTRQSNCYYVEALVDDGYRKRECSFNIDNDKLEIAKFRCDCQAYRKPCEHLAAVIYWLTETEIEEFPYHYARPKNVNHLSYYELFQKRQHESQVAVAKAHSRSLIEESRRYRQSLIDIETQDKQYKIIPDLKIDDNYAMLTFSISDGKTSYVIKNYEEFLNALKQKSMYRYGKKMAFIHDIRFFDEKSRKLIAYMAQIPYDSYELDEDNSMHKHKRYIDFAGSRADRYMQELNADFPLIKPYEEKFKLAIYKNKDGYLIGEEGDRAIAITQENIFLMDDNQVYYIKNCRQSLIALIDLAIHDGTYIDEADMAALAHEMIEPNLDILEIVKGEDLLPQLNYEKLSRIELIGDIVDNAVVFKIKAYDKDQKEVSFFDDQRFAGDQNRDIVLAVLRAKNALLKKEEGVAEFDLDAEETAEFLTFSIPNLIRFADVYVSDEIKKLGMKTRYRIEAGVRIHNGLLEMDIRSLDFNVDEVPAILSAYRKRKKYIKLKSGVTVHLESDELDELDKLFKDLAIDPKQMLDGKISLDTYRSINLENYLAENDKIEINREESLKTYLDGFNSQKADVPIKEAYLEILRDYQKYGVNWLLTLYRYGFNGILADEMGLGKTLEVIALLDSIEEKGSSMVVCPASLIYNWGNEIKRFSHDLKVLLISGNKKERLNKIQNMEDYDIIVTSYDYLRRDIAEYQNQVFNYVIIDEAQNIKNQKTQNAECVKQLKAKHRLALSGTPIENSLAELWSLFDFLMPGYLYSYHEFKERFEAPIVLDNDDKAVSALKAMVSPFILRRVKKEVLKELPDKVDHEYYIEFTPEEKKLYLANLATVNKTMQIEMHDKIDRIAVLAMLTRLREICCDSRLIYDNIQGPSSKIMACMDLVKNLIENNKKVLIFSSFTTLIDLLIVELKKANIAYHKLIGSTPKEERQRLVESFQNDDTPVFLISLKAGGTGLNLTVAEAVIHIDPWWNISAQNQATDRAHRIGQNANVQVYRMLMKDSIEEKITKIQNRKQALAESFVEGNDGSLAHMSKGEIMDLFKE